VDRQPPQLLLPLGHPRQEGGLMRVRLTLPQQAALECRRDGLEPLALGAWQGRWLLFSRDQAEDLMSELIEASNAEDAQAERLRHCGDLECARFAARDSRALGNVASRIVRALREES
jgi:urease accessory protein UreH